MDESTPRSIEALLLAVQADDHKAFAQLVERTKALVVGVVGKYLHRDEDIEDVSQDVFLLLYEKVKKFDPARGSGETWIATISMHRALEFLRGRNASTRNPGTPLLDASDVEPVGRPESSPLERVTRIDFVRRLSMALQNLSPSDRALFIDHDLRGRSNHEIASELGVDPSTVYERRRKVLARLRRFLNDE